MTTQAQEPLTEELLEVGEPLFIMVGEGDSAGMYQARVIEFLNDGIVITEPEFLSGETLITEEATVSVQATQSDAALQFHSQIKLLHQDDQRQVILSPPRAINRVQRRQFSRVEIPGFLTYKKIHSDFDWLAWDGTFDGQRSSLIDISGGGALFSVQDNIQPLDILLMTISLFEEAELPNIVLAQCRRVYLENDQKLCGVQFVLDTALEQYFKPEDIPTLPDALKQFTFEAQERLVDMLFGKQTELKQKGTK